MPQPTQLEASNGYGSLSRPNNEGAQLRVKLPLDLLDKLDHWCIDHKQFRYEAVAELLLRGMTAMNIDGLTSQDEV